MNEHIDLERFVAGHIASEGATPLADDFYDELLSRAGDTAQRPRWLALIKEAPMRTSNHLAVGSPMARVAAIAVATSLLIALVAGAGVAGSQLLSPAPGEEAAFPTGTYVATTERSDRFVMFNDDGTCLWVFTPDTDEMDCTYSVDGDQYTQTSYEGDEYFDRSPFTLKWHFDGEYLTFDGLGDGAHSRHRAAYVEQPYRQVPDPRLVVVADYDIEAGTELYKGHTDLRVVAGAEAPADALVDQDLAAGRVTTTAIAKDAIITPDMLEAG